MTHTIPTLTPEESALVLQAEKAEHIPMATLLRYLHWSKARRELLESMLTAKQLLLDLEAKPVSEKGG